MLGASGSSCRCSPRSGMACRAVARGRARSPRLGPRHASRRSASLGIAFVSRRSRRSTGSTGERAVVSASRFLPVLAGVAMLLVVAALVLPAPRPRAVHGARRSLSVTFACLLALLQLVAGDQPIPLIARPLRRGRRPRASRASPGPFFNPNYFGLFAGLGRRARRSGIAGRGAAAPPRSRCCACRSSGSRCSATLSRGAVAATGVGVLAWLWFRNRQLAALSGAAASSLGPRRGPAPRRRAARLADGGRRGREPSRACRRATRSASSPSPPGRRCSCSTRCSASASASTSS